MTKTLPILILSAALLPAQAPTQQPPQSIAGVVRYNKVPISKEPLRVKLPRPVEQKLSNGIRLLVVENHRIPEITLRITIPTGDLRNPPGLQGLADATAALIRMGTKTRSSKDIAEALAELGASINFGSGQDSGSIFLNAMTENFDASLDLLADILLNPTFPQDEFDKWKTRQRAQIEQNRSQPGFLALERISKVLYPDDARQYVRPTVESLAKMTRDDVVQHYRSFYVPSGQWAGIAGDINAKDALAKLEKALGGWKGGPVAKLTMPLPGPIEEKKISLIQRPNSVQTYLLIANRAIDRTSPDYIVCQVMNRVLGSGPSSRLFRIIREEKGYTYGVGSGFVAGKVTNYFEASTSVRTEVTEPALTELLHQFSDIRDRAVPSGELADAKSAIVAGFVLGLESAQSVLGRWMEQREYGFSEDYWDTYSQKVMAVTAEDVQRVAKKYVPVGNAQIVAVGDSAKIGELLKKFGPVEEISVEQ
jgi:predicted Zn-dependent peptidase